MGEHRSQPVDPHASCLHFLDCVLNARDQSAEVEAARFYRVDVGVGGCIHEREHTVLFPPGQIPAEAAHVFAHVGGGLLERDEHSGLTTLDACGEELNGEDGFAAA